MPWYWIVAILCAIVGPFEAMYTYNQARRRREERRRQAAEQEKDPRIPGSEAEKYCDIRG